MIRGVNRGSIPFAVRADAGLPTNTEINAAIVEFRNTFEAFKAKNDERLTALAKGRDDVVDREHVERINAQVTELDRAMRTMNERLALAARAGSMDLSTQTPEQREHNAAFTQYVRKGVDAGLSDLAVKAALRTDSNTDGGYTVPEELDRQITRVAMTRNGLRSVAGQQTIGVQAYEKLHNIGGANAGWVAERGARTQTNTPQLVKISIPANEMYAMPAATQTMLDDSFIAIDAWLAQEVAIAMADLEGAAAWTGDGIEKPKGMHSYTFAASTIASPSAWERVGYTPTGTSAGFGSSNPGDKLIDLIYSLRVGYRTAASFICNDHCIAELRKLKDGQGNYLLEPKINATGANFSLMGYDVTPDDNAPVIAASSYSLGFGDWSRFYKFVDRMGARIIRDPFSSKPYILFYTTKRVGGGIEDFQAAKWLKFATS
ncbi:MAG: phage major capsid protein [Saprospiraceae bacterium]